jgi:hypothetical protein
MSDPKVSMQQLTSYTLNDSNWQLWRKDVVIGMKCIKAYNIMVGTEQPPPQGNTNTTQLNPDSENAIKVARMSVNEANIGLYNAQKNVSSHPEDDGLKAQLEVANNELDRALAQYATLANERKPPVLIASLPGDTDPTAWDRRHDQGYRLLQMSLSDPYKELTFDCMDLPSTWLTLKNHFESKAAADVMAAETQLENLKLNETGDVLEFLNNIRLIKSALTSAGAPVADRKLFLTVIRKLPKRMQSIQDTILYGPEDRKTYAILEQTLMSYAKNNPKTSAPEQANSAVAKEKFCKHCKRKGHVKDECHARLHTCTKCGKTGHFEKRCKSKEQDKSTNSNSSKDAADDKHASHYAFSAALTATHSPSSWVIDTGATTSISPHIVPANKTSGDSITIANGTTVPVIGYGEADVGFKISSVLCVPTAHRSLISIGKACEDGDIDEATFDEHGCKLYKNGELIASGNRRDGLYELNKHQAYAVSHSTLIWHQRLAHSPIRTVSEMQSQVKATGIQTTPTKVEPENAPKCEACEIGKSTRLPFEDRNPEHRSTKPGRVLHTDLCGPMQVQSMQGSKYCMPIVDDYSRFVTVYFMENKDQAADLLLECIRRYENTLTTRVNIIQTDNGGEFTSNYLRRKLKRKGIKLQTTVPYTPEQNGVAERMNRTLVDRARTLLTHAGLPVQYWQVAIATAAHITNRLPSSAASQRSPYELWTGHLPDVRHLRVFGCRAYAHVPDQKRRKFDPKATTCIFLGYATEQKGYRLQDEATGKIFISRDVSFDENLLPRKSSVVPDVPDVIESKGKEFHLPPTMLPTTTRTISANPVPPTPTSDTDGLPIEETDHPTTSGSATEYIPDADDSTPLPQKAKGGRRRKPDTTSPAVPTRTSARVKTKPARLEHELEDEHIRQLKSRHAALLIDEPSTYEVAIHRHDHHHWQRAMKTEFDSLMKNGTWTLCELPPGRKAIRSKWVYKTKTNQDGSVERYKARLVAQGFSQRIGIDYDDTFSPVASMTTIRTLIGLKAIGWHVRQLDVDTAYLNADLDVDLYITQPKGFESSDADSKGELLVCKLHKAIYGLKQAGLAWYNHLSKLLVNMGFRRSSSDTCLFTSGADCTTILVATYVDDIIVASRSLNDIINFENIIATRLRVKLIGAAKYLLGWKISEHDGDTVISQGAYVSRILEKFGMADSHPVKTPSLKEQQTHQDQDEESTTFPYRELVGSLLYVANSTRPDIAQAVNHAARFVSKPSQQDVVAVKRILRYLKGTVNHGITFKQAKDFTVTGYADADFANDYKLDARSTSGIIFVTNGPILWSSKRQTLTALSTTEAEVNALTDAAKQAAWLTNLFKDMQLGDNLPPISISEDNAGCLALVNGLRTPARTKHIAVRIDFIRDLIKTKVIKVIQCPTAAMVADPLTKPLGAIDFQRKLATIMTIGNASYDIDDHHAGEDGIPGQDMITADADDDTIDIEQDDLDDHEDNDTQGAEKCAQESEQAHILGSHSRESVESRAAARMPHPTETSSGPGCPPAIYQDPSWLVP